MTLSQKENNAECILHTAYQLHEIFLTPHIMSYTLPSLCSFQAIFFHKTCLVDSALGTGHWLNSLNANTVHICCTGPDLILYIYIVLARIIYCTYILYRLGSCTVHIYCTGSDHATLKYCTYILYRLGSCYS